MVINFNMYFASEWVIRHFRSSYVCNPLKKSSMLKFMLIYTFMKIHPGSVAGGVQTANRTYEQALGTGLIFM